MGASECGLAAVEALLLHQTLAINYVTLLAPGGIAVGGPACEYTAGLVARLGLEAPRVTVLDGELVGIDVQQRIAQLGGGEGDDGGTRALPYDLLLVASGLQEQSREAIGEMDLAAAGIVFNALELG